uniref:uncharacterized protein At1g66480-like n=1 Tax=Erigeron canadensis TaxID=72917 RepID=UPI001CB91C2D|nr:uncharacterized protein At1g66480-like [Erigeron canadensis]
MGNNIANAKGRGKKKAKVMKIDGEVFKLKTPIKVFEVIKDYPGHVLLESKAVKQYGIRANPLDAEEYLVPGKIYFLVELPKLHETSDKSVVTRRVKSGVNLTKNERLQLMMEGDGRDLDGYGSVQVKVRLPKAEMDKVVKESRDEMELVEKIVDLYVHKKAAGHEPRLIRED